MPSERPAVLRKALDLLKEQVASRKARLEADLAKQQALSPEDEAWLDNYANLADEHYVVDVLEQASDYAAALESLTPEHREAVARLERAAQKPGQTADGKRKRPVNPKPTAGQSKKAKAPVFERKENATLRQRIEILNWHKDHGKSQSKTASHFDAIYPNLKLKQPIISAWLKKEVKWREQWEDSQRVPGALDSKRAHQTEHPEISDMMDLWVLQAREAGIVLTGAVLRSKWTRFADLAGIPTKDRLALLDGWLAKFKKRHTLRDMKHHGEAASTDIKTVEAERARIQKIIRDGGYQPRDIYNMDETGLFYQMPPDRDLADRKLSGVKGKKTRLTYVFTCNADGSDKLPPFVIGKFKKPRPFNGKTGAELGFDYHNNAKAWMTAVLYTHWIEKWDTDLTAKGRKVLLLQDNFSGHIVPKDLRSIRVENFEPNLTPHVQPDDQGIIRTFKAHYRAKYIERAVDRYDLGISPSLIYDIDILTAMRLADAAWKEVDATTICHCWRRAGILPDFAPSSGLQPRIPVTSLLCHHPSDPISQAETAVTQAVDSLVLRGVLQKSNCMRIESLLNPAVETEVFSEISEEEIFEAVQDAVVEDDERNIEMENQTEMPTRRDVLQAAAVIKQFTMAMDDPVARKVEDILGSFSRQLRLDMQKGMIDTTLMNYFHRQ